jgi:hypothetical protein
MIPAAAKLRAARREHIVCRTARRLLRCSSSVSRYWQPVCSRHTLAGAPDQAAVGSTGINVATRLMALIVASVAIAFILTGIAHRFNSGEIICKS